jgi:hypothetical protein
MTATGQVSQIAHDVDLEVVIASPSTTAPQRAYEEADQVSDRWVPMCETWPTLTP